MTKHAPKPTIERAEFDEYAQAYSAGMDNKLKAMLGESADDFILVKLNWLERRFPELATSQELNLLDYGCGTGALLRAMARRGWLVTKTGCDISEGMLQQGRALWDEACGPMPTFSVQDCVRTEFADNCFDVVIISAVLHHIPLDQRNAALSEILRVLKPGGSVVVFEHNTHNPVTRYVVANTPIDQNAILLPPKETVSRLSQCGFSASATVYIMFAPPKTELLRQLDRFLGWLPLGAQYAVTAAKPG
ncbi:MAG: methyltransferase domain-containing protein [Rhodobiaceae bacterium]|nr:methyltransferase domain-containing protein [Rhodobiaceae bacterium]MCC0054363.1 methyltransferase domain-containing protein [Rhodobiaceae bacterium]